ncbi:MAG: hypothetical protein WDO16_15195 [Bacteroidota bacterium]
MEGFENQSDSLMAGRYTSKNVSLWKEIQYGNLYNYELLLQDSNFTQQQKFEIMQEDLNRFFVSKGISGGTEKRTLIVMALVRTSDKDKIATAGGVQKEEYTNYSVNITNVPFSFFISKFQTYYAKEGELPIRDNTGYKGKVDLIINADLKDLNAVNSELKKYDLEFIKKEEILDVLVIKKK